MGELGGALGEVFLVLGKEPRQIMSGSSAGEEAPRYTTSGSNTTTSGALDLLGGQGGATVISSSSEVMSEKS